MKRIETVMTILAKNETRIFDYGEWDCCILAAEIVLALTGEDKFARFRGRYTDKKSSLALIRKQGKGTLYKSAIEVLGKPIPKTKVWIGDLVFHDGNIGVCAGKVAKFIGDGEYVSVPMSEIKIVFGVR